MEHLQNALRGVDEAEKSLLASFGDATKNPSQLNGLDAGFSAYVPEVYFVHGQECAVQEGEDAVRVLDLLVHEAVLVCELGPRLLNRGIVGPVHHRELGQDLSGWAKTALRQEDGL